MHTEPHLTPLTGKSVIITGAAGGIGRALAVRLAAAGANITVNDLDDAGAHAVAREVSGIAVTADCASEDGIAALIAGATSEFGQVDVFIANAGVSGVGDIDASDEDWQLALDVNVMAHVRAARLLVPLWIGKGGGRFVVTASAAGLLTMPGAAPYAASKHAAVAFAEWLSMTYRHRGIVVQAICPQAVRTQMLGGLGALAEVAERTGTLSPEEVAEQAYQGMLDDRFLILPHPDVHRFYMNRATDTDRWLGAMNSLVHSATDS
ncbi:dehydrogenase [Rhodococcus sp. EPR-157]|uniref:SDR family NAD(P)-dependent oxidoreductase n=1 Tax=Rhodococcus sp. EPR-157 TaxID=1813677 RepID=UPI0007BB6A17|nr:SDR family oxidoreductase [Rhodococcus sp. EPR-157]KZF13207.1 dehydrogenase [Rhodococcus sp. EPR-157]